MRLRGKVALVTGGTDGIGLQLARQLKAKGAEVVICGRDHGRLAAARAEGLQAVEADLSTKEGYEALVEELGSVTLDILVNNAGMGGPSDLLADFDLAKTDQAIFLNLNAPMHLIARSCRVCASGRKRRSSTSPPALRSRHALAARSIARPRRDCAALPKRSDISSGQAG